MWVPPHIPPKHACRTLCGGLCRSRVRREGVDRVGELTLLILSQVGGVEEAGQELEESPAEGPQCLERITWGGQTGWRQEEGWVA